MFTYLCFKDGNRNLGGIDIGKYWELNIRNRNVKFVKIKDGLIIRLGHIADIYIEIDVDTADFSSIKVRQTFKKSDLTAVSNCVGLDKDNHNWYGGPQQSAQYPLEQLFFADFPYVTSNVNNTAIAERYWLSSKGFFILIDHDVPLFLDQNNYENEFSLKRSNLCFTAKREFPYDTQIDTFSLNYKFGIGKDARETHIHVINGILGKPEGIPNEVMVHHPVWNTLVKKSLFCIQRNENSNVVIRFVMARMSTLLLSKIFQMKSFPMDSNIVCCILKTGKIATEAHLSTQPNFPYSIRSPSV